MSDDKATAKTAALQALARASEEAARVDCNRLVVAALIHTARQMVEILDERQRKRPAAKPAKGAA